MINTHLFTEIEVILLSQKAGWGGKLAGKWFTR